MSPLLDGRAMSGSVQARSVWGAGSLLLLAFVFLAMGGLGLFDERSALAADDEFQWQNVTAGLTARGVSSLRIHPKEPDVLYAYVHGMGIARSRDGGKTWDAIMNGVRPAPGPSDAVRISFDPAKPRALYLMVNGEMYYTENGGANWEKIASQALASYSWDRKRTKLLGYEVLVNPKKSVHLLVGTRSDGRHHGGLYESKNGGKIWGQIAGSNLPKTGLGHDAWMVRLDPKTEKNVLVAGRAHVWSSDDRGRTFVPNDPVGEGPHHIRAVSEFVKGGKNLFLADSRGIWQAKGIGKSWGKAPVREGDAVAVVVDPHNRKRVMAVFHDEGLFVSDDPQHKKWAPLGGDDAYAAAEIREIEGHPTDKKLLYLASPATGLHVTDDRGETIAAVEETNIPLSVPPVAAVAVHPGEGHVHLAATTVGVVFRSEDHGRTWVQVGRLGMEPLELEADAAAPGAWLATGRELLRSTDNGATWKTAYRPVDAQERVIDVQHGKDGTLFLLLERSGKVLSSTDRGATWTAAKDMPPFSTGTWATSLAVDPANASHMLIAARTLALQWSDRDTDGGVFETWDGGASWEAVAGNLAPNKAEAASARAAKANWNRGRRVVIDPVSGLLVYIADGGGVFVRPPADPKNEPPVPPSDWVAVTPTQVERATYPATVYTRSRDGKTSRLVLQLRGENDARALVAINGAELKAMWTAAQPGADENAKPDGWSALPLPVADLRADLASLSADAALPGRLIGSDATRGRGIFIYEIPGATPPEKKEPGGEAPASAGLEPPEGLLGFSAGADSEINVWHLRSGKREKAIRGHKAAIRAVSFATDETVLASGGLDGQIYFWHGGTGEPMGEIDARGHVNALCFDDDTEKVFAGLESWQILVIDKETRKVLHNLEGHAAGVTALAAGEDTNRVYSGSKDGTVRAWDLSTKTDVLKIVFGEKMEEAEGTPVHAIAVSKDGKRIYVGGKSDTVRVYDEGGEEVAAQKLGQGMVHALVLAPEGDRLYVGGSGGVDVLSAADLTPILKHAGPKKDVTCLALSADGLWILGGDSDNGLWLWGAGETKVRWSNPGAHAGPVLSLTMTPDETERPEPAPGNGGAEMPPPDDAGKSPAKPGDGAKKDDQASPEGDAGPG